ncbi:MAG: hypothetical protein ABWZ76_08680 [Acidimicrobiales bacterium]
MRARRGLLLGWVAVGAYATLLGAVSVAALRDDSARPVVAASPDPAAEQLVEAWERSRTATFVTTGTYERFSDVTGASLSSEDVVAQRPPRRLHRQLGGVNGRDDDRLLLCPAPPPGATQEPEPCRLGSPGGPTYEESVDDEVAALRSLLLGGAPLYEVASGDPGCFDLELVRVHPRAPFGIAASFCFDPATGAPAGHRVRHEGGIEEVLVVAEIRSEVTSDDLEP